MRSRSPALVMLLTFVSVLAPMSGILLAVSCTATLVAPTPTITGTAYGAGLNGVQTYNINFQVQYTCNNGDTDGQCGVCAMIVTGTSASPTGPFSYFSGGSTTFRDSGGSGCNYFYTSNFSFTIGLAPKTYYKTRVGVAPVLQNPNPVDGYYGPICDPNSKNYSFTRAITVTVHGVFPPHISDRLLMGR